MSIGVKDKTKEENPSRMVLGTNYSHRKKYLPGTKKGVAILVVILAIILTVATAVIYLYKDRHSDTSVIPHEQMSEEMKLLKDYKPQPTEELRYEIK